MTFYLFAILLLLLGIAVIIWAWLKARVQNNSDFYAQRARRNTGLFQQREAQLQQELADGLIDAADFEQLQAELARDLLASVDKLEQLQQQEAQQQRGSGQRYLWLLLLMALPVIAVAVYQQTGAYQDWQISKNLEELNQANTEADFKAQQALLLPQIKARLAQRPEHIDYRILLAQFGMQTQRYDDAALHYGILSELLSDDAQAHAYYAQALYLRDGRQITADVAVAMDKTLAINPANTTVLGMQGIDAFDKGDYQAAVDVWQQLLLLLPPQSSRRTLIEQGLAEAKKRLGITSKKETPESAEGIWLTVSLGENVPTLAPSTTVFIFAKAVSGPKVPLAVKRLTVADLPIKLQLNDSLSMTPQLKLSMVDDVIVSARVSLSGEPIASQGDWMAMEVLNNWREAEPLSLVINKPL